MLSECTRTVKSVSLGKMSVRILDNLYVYNMYTIRGSYLVWNIRGLIISYIKC